MIAIEYFGLSAGTMPANVEVIRVLEYSPVLSSTPEGLTLSDTNLLFYYQNRLAHLGLAWDVIAPPGSLPARPPAEKAAEGGAA